MTKSLDGLRILVIEDEAMVAMFIEDTLVSCGAEVVGPAATVARAEAALEAAGPLDLAVMDLNLRGESSIPVADALDARGIPFVVLTGYGALGLPASHAHRRVLGKPFSPDELVATLRAEYDEPTARDAVTGLTGPAAA